MSLTPLQALTYEKEAYATAFKTLFRFTYKKSAFKTNQSPLKVFLSRICILLKPRTFNVFSIVYVMINMHKQ